MNKIKVATHSGDFHPDEAFAVAVISLYTKIDPKEIEIVRTRDEKEISKADYVVDVGRVLDPDNKKFDHHQGAGERDNKIPYAAFGLVWRQYGLDICGSEKIVKMIDEKLVQPLDAQDNGLDIGQDIYINVHDYSICDAVFAMNPTWLESTELADGLFLKSVRFARWVLMREIDKAKAEIEAENIIDKIYRETEDKRILILDGNYPWKPILPKYKEPMYVIRKDDADDQWRVTTAKTGPRTIKSKKDFPEEWAGKVGDELASITGVPGALFCHRARFICTGKTLDDVMALAKIALEK